MMVDRGEGRSTCLHSYYRKKHPKCKVGLWKGVKDTASADDTFLNEDNVSDIPDDLMMLRPAWDPGKFGLTDLERIRTLLEENRTMKGIIRAKGVCPTCGAKFTEIPGVGYICPEHSTRPKRCFVDLHWKGERIRIFCNKAGEPLEGYKQAETVAKTIEYEIEHYSFNPEMYIKAELSKFWATNLLDRFEKDKVKELAPSYKRAYRQAIRIAKTFFGIKDVREIRKVDIINFIADCRQRYDKWGGKTLKNKVDVFKTFMNYLQKDLEVINSVPPFPTIEYSEKAFKWVSAEDQVRLYNMVPDQDKPLIAFLMLHGCRPGEARALKCKDVDLEHGAITVTATFSENTYRPRRKGKRAKPYTIPIHPEAYDYIADRVRASLPEAFLFTNPNNGKPYSEKVIERIWHSVREEAKIAAGELRLYDATRHSFASQMANSGITLFHVSKALGHSTPKMTDRYAHADIEKMRANLSKITLKTVTTLSPEKKDVKKD